MSKEHQQLTSLLNHTTHETDGPCTFTTGQLGNNTLVLLQSGMGKVNAAVGCTTLLRHYKPDCVLSTGCAGGVDSRLSVMDVVVGRQTCYHDVVLDEGFEVGQIQGLPPRFDGDSSLVRTAMSLASSTTTATEALPTLHEGLICTGDQFITSPDQLAAIKKNFPDALAVDMESNAIAQTCYLHSTPFLSFRTISDIPGSEAHLEQYQDFWGTMADRSFAATRAFISAL